MLKICILGVGRMGRRHIQISRGLGFEVAGIFDNSVPAMQSALQEFLLPPSVAFEDAASMLEQVRPRAVVVASTAPSHCEYVCAAAAAGVQYILCEKPMAISLAECDRMIEACCLARVHLAVNHQMRFMEQYKAVKMLAESAMFGGVRSMTVAGANFGLAMNGSHYFETLRFVTGEEIDSVCCWVDAAKVPNPRGPQYEDCSGQLRATTASGVRLYMEFGGDQGHGVQVIYGCRLGQILVDELNGHMRAIHRDAIYAELPTTRYGMPGIAEVTKIAPADVIHSTAAVWRAMIEQLPFPDGHCGRHAVAGLVAANVSGDRGGALIRLCDGLPRELAFAWA